MNDVSLEKLANYSVLYAEDDSGLQKNMVEFLTLIFKEIHVAAHGQEAYALYEQVHPDLVITDLKMPYMNGIELARKIRQHDTQTHLMIMTAYSDVEFMLEVMDLALLCYTVKPVTEFKLFQAFEKFLKEQEKVRYKKISPECYYDAVEHTIVFKGHVCELTKKEAKLIEKFHTNKDAIVTYEEIENELWGDEYMSHNAMRIMIKNLRKKLPEGVLKNVQGIGYKF